MPTPPSTVADLSWPDYADSAMAGICRSLTADQFEAIEAAQEAFGHVEGLALVVQADPDEQTPKDAP